MPGAVAHLVMQVLADPGLGRSQAKTVAATATPAPTASSEATPTALHKAPPLPAVVGKLLEPAPDMADRWSWTWLRSGLDGVGASGNPAEGRRVRWHVLASLWKVLYRHVLGR